MHYININIYLICASLVFLLILSNHIDLHFLFIISGKILVLNHKPREAC